MVDTDFREDVSVLMVNHHKDKSCTIRTGDTIVQMVILKKQDVVFEKISEVGLLGKTKRSLGGFGSTGKRHPLMVPSDFKTTEICILSDDSTEGDN